MPPDDFHTVAGRYAPFVRLLRRDGFVRWVSGGGSLLLIDDHMPFPGAAETLAAAFGILLADGFATDSTCGIDELVFRRSDRSLADHPITNGRQRSERVDSVAQVSGPERHPVGMNAKHAGENPQFVLNVMHWLAGLLRRRP